MQLAAVDFHRFRRLQFLVNRHQWMNRRHTVFIKMLIRNKTTDFKSFFETVNRSLGMRVVMYIIHHVAVECSLTTWVVQWPITASLTGYRMTVTRIKDNNISMTRSRQYGSFERFGSFGSSCSKHPFIRFVRWTMNWIQQTFIGSIVYVQSVKFHKFERTELTLHVTSGVVRNLSRNGFIKYGICNKLLC
jgi:hypothetical protein